MQLATDEEVTLWISKFGEKLPYWFESVLAGNMTTRELAANMKLSREGARKYFLRYYSEEEIQDSNYGKKVGKLADHCQLPTNQIPEDAVRGIVREEIQPILLKLEEVVSSLTTGNSVSSRDKYRLEEADKAKIDSLLEQLDYLSGVCESTLKLVKAAVNQ